MAERLPYLLPVIAAGAAIAQGCAFLEHRANVPIELIPSPTATASPTPEVIPTLESIPSPEASPTFTPTLSPTPTPGPFEFYGLNFETGEDISILINLPDSPEGPREFNISETPVLSRVDGCDRSRGGSFDPPERTSCIYPLSVNNPEGDIIYWAHTGKDWIFSPYAAETLRDYIEGTHPIRFYNTDLTPEERQVRMDSLREAIVSLSQAGTEITELNILGIYRVPPLNVEAFNLAGLEGSIRAAGQINPGLLTFLGNGQRELFVVFCGINVPGEEAPEHHRWYEWSRYIVVIGEEDETGNISPFLAFIPAGLTKLGKDIVLIKKEKTKKKK
jgi:hypothetical protein